MNIHWNQASYRNQELENIYYHYIECGYLKGNIEYVQEYFESIKSVNDIEQLVKKYLNNACAISI